MNRFLIIIFLIFTCFLANTLTPLRCSASEMVDINTASLEQLDTLTGIGPVYAQRIIDGRPYSSVDDLINVKGIGPATLQKIKDQGLACVNCAAPAPASAEATATPPESPAPPATAPAPVSYPSGIYINEILPNPEGADETDEWIELYNSNPFDVDLSGWQLQDRAGTIKTYTIPSVTKILANGFLVFNRPETKIMLNNDGDGVNLLSPDEKITDSVGFVSAPLGQSYNKSGNNWSWSTTLTPGAKNIIAAPVAKVLPEAKKSDNNSNITPQNLTAGLLPVVSIKNPWPMFFTVLFVAIILGIIVLLIKFKLK